MMNNTMNMNNIPKEKFKLVNEGQRLSDKKFDDKPVGYFKDAWIRFRKNKGSIVAAIIILIIILFSIFAPMIISNHPNTFMDVYYAKKPSRDLTLQKIGMSEGTVTRTFSGPGLIRAIGIGVAAEDRDGSGQVTVGEGLRSYFQPIKKVGPLTMITEIKGAKPKSIYSNCTIETYLEVGFLYKSLEQAEYKRIVDWQNETGLQILYPLVENNEYNLDPLDANYWYKTKKGWPVDEKGKRIDLEQTMELGVIDNFLRDKEGNIQYYKEQGTMYSVRVLYYNYYQYTHGYEPTFVFGTDGGGYDIATRMAYGLRTSFVLSFGVAIVCFIFGAFYGAIEGYYGGWADLLMERIVDILWRMPLYIIVVLFQLHLVNTGKASVLGGLLMAFCVTGWIGTASLVRTQFYRFKNQEYILAARTFGRTDKGKHFFDMAKLRVPIMGTLNQKRACAELSRNLATLIGSGSKSPAT